MKTKLNRTVAVIIFLLILQISCKQVDKKEKPIFTKKYIDIEIGTDVFGTALCNDKFVTLKNNGEFLCLNSNNFKIDSLITKKLNIKKCSAFYQIYDSLIVIADDNDYFINKKFEFIPYKRYSKVFYKKDTTIEYDYRGRKYIDPLFCDSNYIITHFCEGEFGGVLYFFDIKNDKEYCCPATCAATVNKINNKYIITNTLVHGSGHSEILEIAEPTLLLEVNFDTLAHWGRFWYGSYVKWKGQTNKNDPDFIYKIKGDNKQLLDVYGVMMATSFKYNNDLFHIYREPKYYEDTAKKPCEIFIGKIIDNKIVAIDSLYNLKNISSFIYCLKNKTYKEWTLSSSAGGFVAIKNDTINIVEYH